jgi:hypothetical protein
LAVRLLNCDDLPAILGGFVRGRAEHEVVHRVGAVLPWPAQDRLRVPEHNRADPAPQSAESPIRVFDGPSSKELVVLPRIRITIVDDLNPSVEFSDLISVDSYPRSVGVGGLQRRTGCSQKSRRIEWFTP